MWIHQNHNIPDIFYILVSFIPCTVNSFTHRCDQMPQPGQSNISINIPVPRVDPGEKLLLSLTNPLSPAAIYTSTQWSQWSVFLGFRSIFLCFICIT